MKTKFVVTLNGGQIEKVSADKLDVHEGGELIFSMMRPGNPPHLEISRAYGRGGWLKVSNPKLDITNLDNEPE